MNMRAAGDLSWISATPITAQTVHFTVCCHWRPSSSPSSTDTAGA